MNLDAVRGIADAVLYEGYVLYPYRASAQKNRSRWQFGVLVPPDYAAFDPSESADLQTECVLEFTDRVRVEVVIRLLQIQQRTVQRWRPEQTCFEPVDTLELPEGPVSSWDEAVEREVAFDVDHAALLDGAGYDFLLDGGAEVQPVHDAGGALAGRFVRRRLALTASATVTGYPLPGPWQAMRLRVCVANRTALTGEPERRESALPAALVATHVVIGVSGGSFVSSIDPPEWARAAVDACVNRGAWPVLAGPPGRGDMMLAAPIILYDHPELAPESPGDLYDGTEIDEILTLRTLALSDAEKREARATDPRAAAVIDRTEAVDARTIERLHGAIRYLRTAAGAGPPATTQPTPWWDPGADASASPETDAITVNGCRLARGSLVRLRPGARRSDAQDMFLVGRLADVAAVLLDVDDNPYLAVTLHDDPAADLQLAHGRYYYFSPDEVEPA